MMPSASAWRRSAVQRRRRPAGHLRPVVQAVQILADHPQIEERHAGVGDQAGNLAERIVGVQLGNRSDRGRSGVTSSRRPSSPVSIATTLTLRTNGEATLWCSCGFSLLRSPAALALASTSERPARQTCFMQNPPIQMLLVGRCSVGCRVPTKPSWAVGRPMFGFRGDERRRVAHCGVDPSLCRRDRRRLHMDHWLVTLERGQGGADSRGGALGAAHEARHDDAALLCAARP